MPAQSIEVISIEHTAPARRTRRRGMAAAAELGVEKEKEVSPEPLVHQGTNAPPQSAAEAVPVKAIKTPTAKRKDMSPVIQRWSSAERGSADDQIHCRNFVQALRKAMIVRGWGVRDLCRAIGVEMGTMTKYLRGKTSPYRCGFGIIRNLATELGVTMEALNLYFQSGDFGNGESIPVSLDEVETWIRTRAGQEDLLALTAAHNELVLKLMAGAQPQQEQEPEPEPYTWPRLALAGTGIPAYALSAMGLSDEVLDALEQRGEYNEKVVEHFAGLLKHSEEAIRAAFDARQPL